MKRSRFNEEQIIAILKEREAGMATPEVSRTIDRMAGSRPEWRSESSSDQQRCETLPRSMRISVSFKTSSFCFSWFRL
jgi:hypothetical protein